MFKKWKCKHYYMQTKLTKYNPFHGGFTKFICLECHKNKWIHTNDIAYYFEKQRINDQLAINNKIRFIEYITE